MGRYALRRATIVLAFVVAVVTVNSTAAVAISSASASCRAVTGHSATGWVHYDWNGVSDVVTWFSWNIAGQAGSTRNSIHIVVYESRSGPDKSRYSWSSSRIRNGTGSHTPPNYVILTAATSWYTHFGWVFDLNNAPDPDCGANTRTI